MGNFAKFEHDKVYVPIRTNRDLEKFGEWQERYLNDIHLHVHIVPYTDDLLVMGNGRHNMRRVASQIGSVLASSYNEKPLRREKKI
ncbi:MAG: hypothetical protein HYS80_01955 [Candidatus Aenigmarchaeota archaeon]|nr:hypothetical protein [Candidatus Aenigmarchaeota archaeon]